MLKVLEEYNFDDILASLVRLHTEKHPVLSTPEYQTAKKGAEYHLSSYSRSARHDIRQAATQLKSSLSFVQKELQRIDFELGIALEGDDDTLIQGIPSELTTPGMLAKGVFELKNTMGSMLSYVENLSQEYQKYHTVQQFHDARWELHEKSLKGSLRTALNTYLSSDGYLLDDEVLLPDADSPLLISGFRGPPGRFSRILVRRKLVSGKWSKRDEEFRPHELAVDMREHTKRHPLHKDLLTLGVTGVFRPAEDPFNPKLVQYDLKEVVIDE